MDGGGFLESDITTNGNEAKKGTGDSAPGRKSVFPVISALLHKLTVKNVGLVVRQHKIQTVHFLGRVISVKDDNAVVMEFELKDPFGPSVLVQYWKNDSSAETDINNQTADAPRLNSWVHVFGIPKKNVNIRDGLVVLQSLWFREATNGPQEILSHFADCMAAHMKIAQRRINALHGLALATGFPGYTDTSDVPSFLEVGTIQPSGRPTMTSTPARASAGTQASTQKAAIKATRDRIVNFIESRPDGPNGVHVNDILAAVKIPKKELMTHIDWLQEEGHIYSTIDDEHFKSTT